MGQCVSRKAGAVLAASSYSPSYRIMEKPAKNKSHKNSKKGGSQTWGTSISFGFRRRNGSGIPIPVPACDSTHQRSKSAGPEHHRRREEERQNVSGRSTPRLAPPKKEASGMTVRTNRFGFRQQQAKYTDRVSDIASNYQPELEFARQPRVAQQAAPLTPRSRSSPSNHPSLNNNEIRRVNIPEPSKYTLQCSHLPQPQYAVRVSDPNSKVAKTVANQSRKAVPSRGGVSSKEGSGTEDSGLGSHGYSEDSDFRAFNYLDDSARRRAGNVRARNLRMVVNGKSFDVRDVDDDNTVTEISVIPLPKTFVSPSLTTGLVRERTSQYQRILNKDNRYNDSTTSMSTTSSEGYDEGLGEEKVYKDRSHSEKIPSIKSDFSPISSDQEYGHGEAMADDYSFSSSEGGRRSDSMQYLNKIGPAKTGALPKCNLRSVLLTIEDPAFAAVAAKSTTLIDDETSPVDSLFDSPTASITQSDSKPSMKEKEMEKVAAGEDESPGTPTNASNSLSLSEGREYFDDEIADQPALMFDDTSRSNVDTSGVSQSHTDNTLVGCKPIPNQSQRKSTENSPMHGQKLVRVRSIDTLSSCESIASDDLMMDYERSEASSCDDMTHRLNSTSNLHNINSFAHEQIKRDFILLMQGVEETDPNSNNVMTSRLNNNNNPNTAESGISSSRTSRLLKSRSGTDSPRSLDSVRSGSKQIYSPLRTPRNVQSPSIDSGDEGSLRMDRGTYQYMSQDIVCIKTMLLKLKRILQESGENGLTRAEPLNPFDNTVKNGLFYNLNEGESVDTTLENGSVADELADLRRQVVFLQGQLEDKDRTIQSLQLQLTKHPGQTNMDSSGNYEQGKVETCNATTQTEKVRPISAGPSLLESLPQNGNIGPLVSWSNSWDEQPRPPNLTETHPRSVRKPSARLSLLQKENGENEYNNEREESVGIIMTNRLSNGKDNPVKNSSSTKIESTSPKSAIPTPRRLTAPTLIPRAARAISATGRSYNT